MYLPLRIKAIPFINIYITLQMFWASKINICIQQGRIKLIKKCIAYMKEKR